MPGTDDEMEGTGTGHTTEQDHSHCQKQIDDLQTTVLKLEADLEQERDNVAASTKTINGLRANVQTLRDELTKHGIPQPALRKSLDDRIRDFHIGADTADIDASTDSGSSTATYSFDIGGTLLDFSASCPSHKILRLSTVGISASCASLWSAKSVYDLAQGVQVAESLQISPHSRALFFTNNSPLASTETFEPPTEDNLVRVMCKLTAGCRDRQSAFVEAAHKKLVCADASRQSDLKLRVAERVRAELDGKKTLRCDSVLVLGGNNAQVLSEVLGASFVDASTVPDLRTFFEGTHLQAAVQRVFVWLDIDNEQFQLAHQSHLVPALRDVIIAAAKWGHVQFIVLPVPYAHSLLPMFESFMQEFNKIFVDFHNVLWLNDLVRVNGARFAHSLGSNEYVTYWTAVDQVGRVSRRSVRAALRFLRQLKTSLVPEDIDLSDPVKPESGPQSKQPSTSSSTLHGVHDGGVKKRHRDDYSARGVTLKPGGGGNRGQWNNHRGQGANRKGQGSRRY